MFRLFISQFFHIFINHFLWWKNFFNTAFC
jgi:hypothetical protein